jgi:chemotaxis protein MotB
LRRSSYQGGYRSLSRADAIDADDDVNHDRWLVSYADFMTLLMAFFVVMYSISQVSEEKYRILTETFNEAFNLSGYSDAQPIRDSSSGNDANDVPEFFTRITEQLDKSFESLIEDEFITVTGDERWLQIELQSAILFGSGGAVLSRPAEAIIGELSAAMLAYNNVIRVEGFTDNVPIKNRLFSSNWELSTARATAVVRLMESQGVEPSRLAAVGYGEHQPVAKNDTEAGRARNRRIVLMVSTREQLRPNASQIDNIATEASPVDINSTEGEDQSVKGLEQSARAQAEAWLRSLRKPAGAESKRANNKTQLNGEVSSSNTVEGVKQVELENGAILFTSDGG